MKKTLLLIPLSFSLLCAPAPRRSKAAAQDAQKSANAQPQSQRPAASQPQPPQPRPSSQSSAVHFDKDGLSFDYPSGWKLVDRSTEAAQHLILGRDGSTALIMVVAHRGAVANVGQFNAARDAITQPYVEELARRLGVQKVPSWEEAKCLDLGERLPVGQRFATGFKLAGQSDGQPSTGEVYMVALGRRFINLVYVRNDRDDAEGSAAWKLLLDTVKVEAPPGGPGVGAIVSGGVLNGRALKKPQPYYPPAAKAAGQQGTVTVQLVVDEEGKVISAVAVSGAPLLQQAAVDAAKHASFTPTTVCGHAVKVSGVVTYNFVLVGAGIR